MNSIDLIFDDVKRKEKAFKELKIHKNYRCKYCNGKVFWDETWKLWLCESWRVMGGGCWFEDNQP